MKTLLLILLSFSAATVFAQSNFKQGYVITNQNDTIDGWIDFRTDHVNTERCRLKKVLEDVDTIYLPGEIKGYRFSEEGKFYVSDEIEVDGKMKKVFLEYLLQGIVSLYYYPDVYYLQDEKGEKHLISKGDDIEIQNADTKYKTFRKEDTRYIGLLKHHLHQSFNVLKKADKIRYNAKDIVDLTKTYHDDVCTTGEECIIFKANTKKNVKFNFSVYAGLQYNSFKLSKERFNKVVDDITSLSPVVGVQLNLSAPRLNKYLSLQLDISLSGIKSSIYPEEGICTNNAHIYESDFAVCLSNKTGLKYTFMQLSERIQPIIEGGVNLSRFLSSGNSDVIEYNDKTCAGFYAGTGFDYRFKNGKAIIVRFTYDNNKTYNGFGYNDHFSNIVGKLGYTF